jgi:hypothetical protein
MAVRHGFDVLGSNPTAVDNDTTTAVRGYHEVLAVGYDPAGMIIENSWGTGWANGGFGRLSWAVVQNDVVEADVIDGLVPPPPPPPAGPIVTQPARRVVAVRPAAKPATGWTVTYKIGWRGVAGTGGAIRSYDVWYQVDGHPLVPVKLTSATAASFLLVTRTGHNYRVAIRARAAGVVGSVTRTAVWAPHRS